MSDLYTDDDVAAGIAAEFALWESKGGYMPGAEESVPAILDAVAPAIASRALREAAAAMEARFRSGQMLGMPTDDWLRDRADEIEKVTA